MKPEISPLLPELPSVYFDPGSQFKPEEVVEKKFYRNIFTSLKAEMGETFYDYEWWVFSQQNGKAVPACLQFEATKPRVLIWTSDEHGDIPNHIVKHFHAVFKSFILHNNGHKNLFHFPVGYSDRVGVYPHKSLEERGISVYFNGNLNRSRVTLYKELSSWLRYAPSGLDQNIVALLKRTVPGALRLNFDEVFPGGLIGFYLGFMKGDSRSYAECLADTKIALCPSGFVSAETYRHMESMRAGGVVVSFELPDVHIYRNSPIVQVKNWREGLEKIDYLLKHPEELQELHVRSREWWENVMSERAFARHMAQELNKLSPSPVRV